MPAGKHGAIALLKFLLTFQLLLILTDEEVIAQTERWIKSVVIGCNFCPFAAKTVNNGTVHYIVLREAATTLAIDCLLEQYRLLDRNTGIETTFIIFPESFTSFPTYLQLVKKAEQYTSRKGYDGVYQIASFHPDYSFAGVAENDAANYTNRSVFPMLHLLREERIAKALRHFAEPGNIPERNIQYARTKGLAYMEWLRASCM